MKRKVLIILYLAGIFAAGGATGAFVALRVAKNIATEKAKTDSFVLRQYKKITRELELAPEQCEQVNKILRETAAEIEALRKESFRESGVELRKMNQRIAALLTPEQNVKFEEMLKQQRERIRQFHAERASRMEERRGDGEKHGDEPPPPPRP